MRIVYLSWGSLKWNPEELPIKSPDSWIASNLQLPLEFSRVSDKGKGRLTLVIDPVFGTENQVWYVDAMVKNVNQAISALRKREKTSIENIAYLNLMNGKRRANHTPMAELGVIADWMRSQRIDVAIWTDLTSNWQQIMGTNFSPERAYKYFLQSPLETRLEILEYIYKATKLNFIETEFSNYFFRQLQTN